jgi:NAD(P)-dependent dehydrogenase (short-subunit alcohol dehydrogenase family)
VNGRLSGRVALITGAAGGIGRATAQRLAGEGAAVLVTDVDDDSGRAVVEQLIKDGGQAAYRTLDVVSEPAWLDAVRAAADTFGGLDILVNNAGVPGDPEPFEDTPLATWDRSIAVLQTGVFLGMKCAAPLLRRSGHASIINISSIFGASGGFGKSPAYHAAKGAIRTLTKTAAVHWAGDRIRVNSIHPGFIDTDLLRPGDEAGQRIRWGMLQATPMGRLGRPDEVAAGVAYLAADDSSFVTGSELYIDGGYMAR